jgi:hypothetical protein
LRVCGVTRTELEGCCVFACTGGSWWQQGCVCACMHAVPGQRAAGACMWGGAGVRVTGRRHGFTPVHAGCSLTQCVSQALS